MIKFVLDTDVIIAAMRSPGGASAALLAAALDGKYILLASVPLFFEYEAKCTEEAHWRAATLSYSESLDFVNGLAVLVKPIKTHYLWRPMLRDPNDEMVLEVAVNGGAESIVTFNRRDFGLAPEKFNIELLTPSQALRRVRDE